MSKIFMDKAEAIAEAKAIGAPGGSLKIQNYKSKDGSVILHGIGLNQKCLDKNAMKAAAGALVEKYGSDFASRFNAGLSLELGQAARAQGKGEAGTDVGDDTV